MRERDTAAWQVGNVIGTVIGVCVQITLVLGIAAAILFIAGTVLVYAYYAFVVGLIAAPILAIASRTFAPIRFVLDMVSGLFWLGSMPFVLVLGTFGKRRGGGR